MLCLGRDAELENAVKEKKIFYWFITRVPHNHTSSTRNKSIISVSLQSNGLCPPSAIAGNSVRVNNTASETSLSACSNEYRIVAVQSRWQDDDVIPPTVGGTAGFFCFGMMLVLAKADDDG